MTKEKATPSTDRIAWGRYLLLFSVAAWMFILGVLVGRGSAPVEFDTQALQKELAALRDSMVKKERDAIERAIRGEGEKTSLGFYEDLKKDGPDTTVRARDRSVRGSHSSAALPHKQRAAIMHKKKSIPVKPAGQAASGNKRAATARKGKLTIQVASLKDAKAAQRIVANLKKDGYPAYLSKHEAGGEGPWFRVRVGRYPDDREAAADIARLMRDQKKPILVDAE